jgi:ABC-type branched-subunit amino acid transport system substrate-binding protein
MRRLGVDPPGGTLRHSSRTIRILTALAVLAVVVVAFPTAGRAANDTPKATEVGVDAQTIHIATVADVDNPIAPGLFTGGVDGVRGAVKLINKQGGIGGRKLAMDFIDSHLNPNETRNAFITACGQDFALVGTGAFLVTNIDDVVGCKDQAGQTTGLPDIPSVTSGYLDACGSVIYPLNGSQIDCSTQTQTPQTYVGLDGDSKYLNKKYGPLHGTLIVSSDSKSTQTSTTVLGLFAQKAGIKIDRTIPITSSATQIQYTPVIQQIKSGGDNYNLTGTPANNVIEMRQEAQLQGLTDPKFTWTCLLQCYDKALVDAGSVVDGTRVSMSYLPFEEAKTNKTLANFVKYVGKDKINGFAMWGFASTLLFAQVANQVVKDKGVNGLTRANFLATLKDTHSFNAGGMYGNVDPGDKFPTNCFMILNLQGGKYVREYPKKAGTLDCKPSNRTTLEADVLGK